jgi:hypothetical protein
MSECWGFKISSDGRNGSPQYASQRHIVVTSLPRTPLRQIRFDTTWTASIATGIASTPTQNGGAVRAPGDLGP